MSLTINNVRRGKKGGGYWTLLYVGGINKSNEKPLSQAYYSHGYGFFAVLSIYIYNLCVYI